ncbi:uncharacterized protein LOC132720687 [Ruditapes philippinarum]|uniref:uncharacterized protein LOC132720687 n=1 Tax=Ruditapes philippinarum TaxID=129788 RepID=UPI00295B750D|nr:uncharacterized protein LOC132720687 [Ruditapes philippinarum]
MAKHANSTKRFAGVALVFDIFGFCFNLVGIFGPAWLVKADDNRQWTFHEGVWLAEYCQNGTCRVSTREHALEDIGRNQYISVLEEFHWTQFKVLTIMAIVCNFLAVVLTTIFLSKNPKNQTISIIILFASGITSLSSSMFLLIPVLKLTAVDSSNSFSDAWAKILSAVGVFMHFAAAISMVFAVYQSLQHYCAIKRIERSRSRRFEMVERYMSSQQDNVTPQRHYVSSPQENETRDSVNQAGQQVISVSNERRTLNCNGVTGHAGTPYNRPPPYTVAAELPSYSEIILR